MVDIYYNIFILKTLADKLRGLAQKIEDGEFGKGKDFDVLEVQYTFNDILDSVEEKSVSSKQASPPQTLAGKKGGGIMKKIIFVIALVVLFVPAIATAFDAELYFAELWRSNLRAAPDGGRAAYVSHVEVGHRMSIFRPYAIIETIIDEYNESGWFHPASIKYDLGIRMDIKNVYIEISHMCWHPIDSYGVIEQYDMLKFGVRFGKK